MTPNSRIALRDIVGTSVSPTAVAEGGFSIRRLDEFLSDVTIEAQPRWLIDQLLVQGSLNVFYGNPKVGKSTLLAHAATCIALGEPFAGLATIRGPVLWVDLEQGQNRLKRSLASIPGASTPDTPFYCTSRLSNRIGPLAALKAAMSEREYSAVFVDSLAKYAQLTDENDNSAWRAVLEPLEDLARSGAAALVFVDHDRKTEGDHGKALRGGSAKLAAMDSAIQVKRITGKEQARRLDGVSREQGTFTLDLTLTAEGYEPLVPPKHLIEPALRDGPRSMDELLNDLEDRGSSLSRSTVKLQLEELEKRGLVQRTGQGKKGDPTRFVLVHG